MTAGAAITAMAHIAPSVIVEKLLKPTSAMSREAAPPAPATMSYAPNAFLSPTPGLAVPTDERLATALPHLGSLPAPAAVTPPEDLPRPFAILPWLS